MTPQDREYRAFITQLHARMRQAGSRAALIGGIGPKTYAAGSSLLALVAIAIAGFCIRAVATGELAGGLFLVGLRRAVRLADRRLHQAQPAAGLYVRSLAGDVAAVRLASKRNEM